MRISDRLRYEILKRDLIDIKAKIDRAQTIISSGKSLLRPQDDPVYFSSCIHFDSQLKKNEKYKRNVERLLLLGSYYDSCISRIGELLRRAKEIAVSQASDTMNAQSRFSSSKEIKGIIEELVSIGNTNVAGLYIFGGKRLDVKPFSLDNDYNVTFFGTEEVIKVNTDTDQTESLGISGYKVFIEGTNIFGVLKDLKDALETNNVQGIRESLDKIDMAIEKTEANLSYAGIYVSKLERTKDFLDLKTNEIEKIESELRDADLAKIISDFNALTLTYQTMLYAASKIGELNILNYLR